MQAFDPEANHHLLGLPEDQRWLWDMNIDMANSVSIRSGTDVPQDRIRKLAMPNAAVTLHSARHHEFASPLFPHCDDMENAYREILGTLLFTSSVDSPIWKPLDPRFYAVDSHGYVYVYHGERENERVCIYVV